MNILDTLCFMNCFTGASNIIDVSERCFEEINQWGQIIPLQKFIALDFYTKCIDAIDRYFQYPSFFSGLIGYFTILATDHWTDAERNCLKDPELIKTLQTQAEDIILLGWNSRNNNPTIGVGQLDTLIETLHVMNKCTISSGEEIMDTSSSICSIFENQWIKNSFNHLQAYSKANPMTSDMVERFIALSQGNYYELNKFMESISPFFKKRMNTFLSSYGNFKVKPENFKTLVMLAKLKGPSYKTLKDQLAWCNGSDNPVMSFDEYGVGHLPATSTYDSFVSSGIFVKRKQEQLRFKEIYEILTKFARNEELSHLFFMVNLFNSDELRNLQNQYQYLLVKKLAEFKHLFGAENGDQALCCLKNLFSEYISLSGRFIASLKNECENLKID